MKTDYDRIDCSVITKNDIRGAEKVLKRAAEEGRISHEEVINIMMKSTNVERFHFGMPIFELRRAQNEQLLRDMHEEVINGEI